MRLLFSLALLAGCGPDVSITKQQVDADGDGYTEDVDCDDAHASVNPDAAELCNGLDDDCDGEVDGSASDAPTWYADADGDGFGDPSAPSTACEPPEGTVADATDCDDRAEAAFPGNPELCDGIDNDCDGTVDDDPTDLSTYYVDADGDGYGDAATAVEACEAGPGEAPDGTDCDDADATVHPDAPEVDCTDPVDHNCDGSTGYADADGDGTPACEDCDDADAARSPDAAEVCDAADLDEDCDGVSDDDDDVTGTTWYRDVDGDGYAGASGASLVQCEQPAGYSAATGDCDDYDTAANPGAAEVCDALDADEDCDGAADDADASTDAATWTTWYRDADGDAYGDASRTAMQCEPPAGFVEDATDCDDADAGRNPGEVEACDAADVDEDCDGLSDDADASVIGASTWFADGDGDGYGGPTSVDACEMPAGYAASDDDCDDAAAAISPAASELCDAADLDEDCDGLADDDDPSASGASLWYRDADGDGYAGGTTTAACDLPAGHFATATDCDDTSTAVSPAASEVCDTAGVDEDCDGLADDADVSVTGRSTWYLDADGDGYAGGSTTSACTAPSGYLATFTDCDDGTAAISPAAAEICDAADTDEDCDGFADDADGSATGEAIRYRDADGDTWGDPAVSVDRCDLPAGYVDNALDCDDTSGSVGSGLAWYADADGDGFGDATASVSACTQPSGYVGSAGDCDDDGAATSPVGTEVCDAADADEDCDGLADDADTSTSGQATWYVDADGDGYGSSTALSRCDQPSGYVATADDCDDSLSTASPGGTEVCDDGIDQDCSGADEACPFTGLSGSYDADSDYDVRIDGTTAGDAFGDAMVSGDFDGDGVGDIVVATSDAIHTGSYAGTVYGYYGPFTDGAQGAEDNDSFLYYNNTSGFDGTYGTSLVNMGDLDNDGSDDLLVYASQSRSAYAYLYYGGDSGTSTYSTRYDDELYSTICHSIRGAGDFNGSGYDEYLCNAWSGWTTSSSVYVVSLTGSSSYVVEYRYEYSDNGTGTMAGGEDVDGDGYDDVWVGAYFDDAGGTNAGAAYLEYAPGSGISNLAYADAKIYGDAASVGFGRRLEMKGDVDGDGHADLLATAPVDATTSTGAGAIYVVTSPTSGSASGATARIIGEDSGDEIGLQGLDLGDIDGDGELDLVASSIYNADAGTYGGSVWLVYGPLSGTIEVADGDAQWIANAYDELGYGIAVVDDSDGDGCDEIAMSAPAADPDGSTNAGAVWIWYGQP